MKVLARCLLPALLAACGDSAVIVVPTGLAPGGGGAAATSRPQLDLVVRIESDATGFRAADIMRLFVDGVDRAGEAVIGGLYAVLPLDPAPVGMVFVQVARRTGPILDSFTWNVAPYAGPVLDSVAPDTAMTGTQVTIAGSGFSAGALRVFFGGEEGTVDASNDTSITATVPAGAVTGLVWVLVGDEAAEGLVAFTPLDAMGVAIPAPEGPRLFAAFPAHAGPEDPVRVYGVGLDDAVLPVFNALRSTEFLGFADAPGGSRRAFGIVAPGTPAGAGTLEAFDTATETTSNALPFSVDG